MPRIWPGYLAVWAAIILHFTWVVLLCIPRTHAFNATPVHEVYKLAGFSVWRTAVLLGFVAAAACVGLFKHTTSGMKLVCLLPQQMVLGISAAGATVAVFTSKYADGVPRPATFIAADQLAVVLTWGGHTFALMLLYLIHTNKLALSGRTLPPEDEDDAS